MVKWVLVAYKSFSCILLERFYPAKTDHPDKIIQMKEQKEKAETQTQNHNVSIKV